MAKATQVEKVLFDFEETKEEPKKTTPKKTAPKKTVAKKPAQQPVKVEEKVEEEVKEEVKVEEKVIEKPKTIRNVKQSKFSEKDLVPCRSVTSGGLNFIGASGNKVRFENYGMIEYVEYGDLRREAQSANPTNYLYYPRFVVIDPDFVEEFPKLDEFYSKFYADEGDFDRILELPNDQLKEEIDKLPKGCRECLKGMVATRIDEGTLDSVQRIKLFDEIFGTNLFLMLANN